MTKLTILFQLRLSATNPAPAELHTFNIEGESATGLKADYKRGIEQMKKQYPQYKHIRRIAVFEDKSDALRIIGILDPPSIDLH